MLLKKDCFLKIKDAEIIVATNHGIGVSLALLLFIRRIKNKKLFVINSGLFDDNLISFLKSKSRKILTQLTLNNSNKIICTSKKEYKFAINKFNKEKNKIVLNPFCVDTAFWVDKSINFLEKEQILFVGNNEYRDIEKLIKIVEGLPKINFKLVTSLIDENINIPKNVKLIKGDWNKSIINDDDLKSLYKKSRLTILPVVNTLTSSGQSVAQQSMSMGTPVVINLTKGFWDEEIIDGEDITLVKRNELDVWINTVEKLYNDKDRLEKISLNGVQKINKNFNLDIFNKKMFDILFKNY